MSRVLTYKHVVRALNHLGYFEHRQKGSHVIFLHSDGRITVVPKQSNGEVAGGTVGKICRDIGVSFDEFEKSIGLWSFFVLLKASKFSNTGVVVLRYPPHLTPHTYTQN